MVALAFVGLVALSASFFMDRNENFKSGILQKETPSALKVEPEILDLGTLSKKNGKAEGSYTLSNEGSEPLELRYAFASCECATANLKRQTLEPGDTASMKITYDPNYFAGESGDIKKQFTIYSDDPKSQFKKVFLQAKVIP